MKKLILNCLLFLAGMAQVRAQVGFQRTPKGASYRIYTHSTSPKIKLSDVVTFHVIQKTDRDSLLFSSYAAGHPVQIQVQPSQNVADLMEIFPQVAANDSLLVKVPADSVFKDHENSRPAFLPKGSSINYVVKIVKVQNLSEAMADANAALDKLKQAEAADADKYIADHKLTLRTTPSGLKYIITRASVRRKPLPGDTVLVNYTGRMLSGKVFDSSIEADARAAGLQQAGRTYEPIQVVVGQGQVIPGWDEGLQLLNEGSKAMFIIPSKLGYGQQGAGDIKPFSTLIFDVELVKVKPARRLVPTAKKAVTHTAVKKAVRKS